MGSLREYRKENGLCFKCGEKWGPGHKCPAQVSINVVEELLDAIDDSGVDQSNLYEESEESEGIMAIGTSVLLV